MRSFFFCLAVLVATACASSTAGSAESHPVPGAGADGLQQLLDDGAHALRERRWTDAAQLFETAHARVSGAQRGELAFFWGAALFQQGAALMRTNTSGDLAQADDARGFFEQAEAILEGAEHPMRDELLRAIRRYVEGLAPIGPLSGVSVTSVIMAAGVDRSAEIPRS